MNGRGRAGSLRRQLEKERTVFRAARSSGRTASEEATASHVNDDAMTKVTIPQSGDHSRDDCSDRIISCGAFLRRLSCQRRKPLRNVSANGPMVNGRADNERGKSGPERVRRYNSSDELRA